MSNERMLCMLTEYVNSHPQRTQVEEVLLVTHRSTNAKHYSLLQLANRKSVVMSVLWHLILQADLALSPMALGPGPMVPPLKSPGQRLQLPGLSPSHPRSPVTPTAPVTDKQEVEAPTSFESPADGALLPSINKVRVKRRRSLSIQ